MRKRSGKNIDISQRLRYSTFVYTCGVSNVVLILFFPELLTEEKLETQRRCFLGVACVIEIREPLFP